MLCELIPEQAVKLLTLLGGGEHTTPLNLPKAGMLMLGRLRLPLRGVGRETSRERDSPPPQWPEDVLLPALLAHHFWREGMQAAGDRSGQPDEGTRHQRDCIYACIQTLELNRLLEKGKQTKAKPAGEGLWDAAARERCLSGLVQILESDAKSLWDSEPEEDWLQLFAKAASAILEVHENLPRSCPSVSCVRLESNQRENLHCASRSVATDGPPRQSFRLHPRSRKCNPWNGSEARASRYAHGGACQRDRQRFSAFRLDTRAIQVSFPLEVLVPVLLPNSLILHQ